MRYRGHALFGCSTNTHTQQDLWLVARFSLAYERAITVGNRVTVTCTQCVIKRRIRSITATAYTIVQVAAANRARRACTCAYNAVSASLLIQSHVNTCAVERETLQVLPDNRQSVQRRTACLANVDRGCQVDMPRMRLCQSVLHEFFDAI